MLQTNNKHMFMHVSPFPLLWLLLSDGTCVTTDAEHVPLRQQNPRNPTLLTMTTNTPAYAGVKFQLPVDSLADCCQSA